ncbi:MAG: hypothetical protein JST90_17445 [Bacteroidetes bacterium]|nr:hypothetical protein [Bacteroidota bacterium]
MIYIKTNTSSGSQIFDLIEQQKSKSLENLLVEIECNSLTFLPDRYATIAEVFFKQVQLLIGDRCEKYLNSYIKSVNIDRFKLSPYRNSICHDLAAIADKMNSRTALLTFPCESPHSASTNLIHFLNNSGRLNMNIYSRSIYLDYLAKDLATFYFLGQLVGYSVKMKFSLLHFFIGSFDNTATNVSKLVSLNKPVLFNGTLKDQVDRAEEAINAIIEDKALQNGHDYFSEMVLLVRSKSDLI